MKHRIFISAGEVSGDLHGSYLAKRLFEIEPELEITGIGSRAMKDAGVTVIRDIAPYSSVGIVESIPSVFPVSEVYKLAKETFSLNPPDIVVLIDNQGFNFRLADLSRKYKIPVVYYIGPQEWIWGFKKGPQKVINKVDKIFTVFAKEYQIYRDLTDKAEFVGHPLLDILIPESKDEIRNSLNLRNDIPVIGIMPGSRKHEIMNLLPVYLETAKSLKNKKQDVEIILIISPLWKSFVENNFDLGDVRILSGISSYLMQACDLIIVASGTVTLEASILNIPVIAGYKLSKISYILAKMLIRLKHFTLPNIISDKKVIPEFIQEQVNSENLTVESLKLLEDNTLREKMFEDFGFIRKALEPKGAVNKTAEGILKLLKNS